MMSDTVVGDYLYNTQNVLLTKDNSLISQKHNIIKLENVQSNTPSTIFSEARHFID